MKYFDIFWHFLQLECGQRRKVCHQLPIFSHSRINLICVWRRSWRMRINCLRFQRPKISIKLCPLSLDEAWETHQSIVTKNCVLLNKFVGESRTTHLLSFFNWLHFLDSFYAIFSDRARENCFNPMTYKQIDLFNSY